MSEAQSKATLIRAIKPLHPQAIESPRTASGIPDVNYMEGWIECKMMEAWPRNADTHPVKFKHTLSKEQGLWLWQRRLVGGSAWCCCQVNRSWFFFDGLTIKDKFDRMTRPEMVQEALLYMPRGMEAERLVSWLRSFN